MGFFLDFLLFSVVLLPAVEGVLLLAGLETTVTELRRGVDELELDLLEVFLAGGDDHALSQEQESLLWAHCAALEHEEVVLDGTVVGESSHGGDVLLSDIGFGGGVVLGSRGLALSHSVDLLVGLSSVEETLLTGAGHCPGHTGWMPGSDTSDFSVASVGLLLEVPGAPSLHDSGETFALGDTDDVDELILAEDLVDLDFLLEVLEGEVDFLGDVLSSVDLDFEDVVPLLSEVLEEAHLGVGDGSHHCAVLLDSVELGGGLLGVLGDFGLVVGEGFLLGVVPVLVESPECALVEVLGPDGGEGSESSGGVDVSDEADDFEGRGFDDGDCFDFLLLIEFCLSSVHVPEDVGHACLEASEGGEVAWL